MVYTNKQNIAQEFVDAIVSRQKDYNRGDADYSVTQLLQSPRQVHLQNRHYDELEIDVAELLSSWEGHLIHDALEKDDLERVIQQFLDIKLSGKCDYIDIDKGVIKDYKTTSVWSIIYESHLSKWEQQLNCYAFLYSRKYGCEIKELYVEAYMTDWQASKARQDKDYPQCKQRTIPIKVWSFEEQYNFIIDKLRQLVDTRDMDDASLPFCTAEEMWQSETKWAVKKNGQQRAVKVFTDEASATQFALEKGASHSVEQREGERVKCERYCAQRKFCNQYYNWKSRVETEAE